MPGVPTLVTYVAVRNIVIYYPPAYISPILSGVIINIHKQISVIRLNVSIPGNVMYVRCDCYNEISQPLPSPAPNINHLKNLQTLNCFVAIVCSREYIAGIHCR